MMTKIIVKINCNGDKWCNCEYVLRGILSDKYYCKQFPGSRLKHRDTDLERLPECLAAEKAAGIPE